jgi:hypothetical protein
MWEASVAYYAHIESIYFLKVADPRLPGDARGALETTWNNSLWPGCEASQTCAVRRKNRHDEVIVKRNPFALYGQFTGD